LQNAIVQPLRGLKLRSIYERVPAGALKWSSLAILFAAAVIFGTRFFDHYQKERDVANQAALETAARTLAHRLGEVTQAQHAALTELAQDPRVVTALSGVDDAARMRLGDELKARVPSALRLRLIPHGMTQTDLNSNPPLTYASLDLLLKSEHQETPTGAEIHGAGTPQEHVAMVRRVPPVGAAVGLLHASLDPKIIRDAVAATLTNSPYPVEVRQPVPGGAPIIIASSAPAGRGSFDTLVQNVPGTAWVLSIRSTASRATDAAMNYIAPAVTIILAGGFIGWGLQRYRRGGGRKTSIVDSVTVYEGAIKTIITGDHPLAQFLPGYDSQQAAPVREKVIISEPSLALDATISAPAPLLVATPDSTVPQDGVDPSIFRSYDIRGIVGTTLTPEAVYQIGRAFGSEAITRKQQTVVVARDGRNSSAALRGALVEGLRDAGCEVFDIGLTPTPVLYFATHYLDTRTGIMITGSHNPAQYNGLKMVLDGATLSGDAIQAIRRRIEEQDFVSGTGGLQEIEIVPDYIRRISEEIPVSLGTALKVVVDCGNSVPGIVAPHILRAIGHDVIELYCEVDGDFPNHHPDPSQPENLEDLIAIVRHEQADLGLAFDGDGDRLGVVDREGNILWPDRQLMLFARDVLSRNPGATVIYDVKCSRLLSKVITEAGGKPLMWKTGHSLIKSKMQETGALLAGEMSGHVFFKERWYGFDDALYSAARLLEILVNANEPPEQVFARLPNGVSTPELRIDMPEDRHAEFMQQVIEAGGFDDGEMTLIDGLRVDLPRAWGLIRPSNTTPSLVLRFEGDTAEDLDNIKARFSSLLRGLDPTLTLPF
jgi:phosphomannomutase / phosphoglucomutase